MERTGKLIAEFEQTFGATFKFTAGHKWGVPFPDSNLRPVLPKLQQLKENMRNGTARPVHVAYEITLEQVERVEALLTELYNRWKQHTHLPPPAKQYTFLDALRDLETPTPEEYAKRFYKELTKPEPSPDLTKKQQKQADIEAEKQRRLIEMQRKQNAKH
jgi:hypothetical protein